MTGPSKCHRGRPISVEEAKFSSSILRASPQPGPLGMNLNVGTTNKPHCERRRLPHLPLGATHSQTTALPILAVM
jgi:hypothetical protein